MLVALVSEVFVGSVKKAAEALGMTPAFVGFIVVALVGGAAGMASAFSGARKNRLRFERRHCAGERLSDRALCRACAGSPELQCRPSANGPPVLARRDRDDAHRDDDLFAGNKQRAISMVSWSATPDGIPDLCSDTVPPTAPSRMKGAAVEHRCAARIKSGLSSRKMLLRRTKE